jgi:hypothetical protein
MRHGKSAQSFLFAYMHFNCENWTKEVMLFWRHVKKSIMLLVNLPGALQIERISGGANGL